MDHKKLFGNATKFINDYTIHYHAKRPQPGFSGQFLFPSSAETLNAKYVMLHEPKTKNLDLLINSLSNGMIHLEYENSKVGEEIVISKDSGPEWI